MDGPLSSQPLYSQDGTKHQFLFGLNYWQEKYVTPVKLTGRVELHLLQDRKNKFKRQFFLLGLNVVTHGQGQLIILNFQKSCNIFEWTLDLTKSFGTKPLYDTLYKTHAQLAETLNCVAFEFYGRFVHLINKSMLVYMCSVVLFIISWLFFWLILTCRLHEKEIVFSCIELQMSPYLVVPFH